MCSFFMLPTDENFRKQMYETLLKNNCEIHFVLENIIIKDSKDVDSMEYLFELRKLINKCLSREDFMNKLKN